MGKDRFSVNLTVGLLLIKNNKILLMRRCNTGYMDGKYAFVAGHVEEGEDLKQAIVREAFEEVGIKIKEEDLQYVCMIRRGDNDNYINFFLKSNNFEGTPKIVEEDKCDELIWCDINNIPENTITAEKRAIYNYLNGISFDEYNFEVHKDDKNKDVSLIDDER